MFPSKSAVTVCTNCHHFTAVFRPRRRQISGRNAPNPAGFAVPAFMPDHCDALCAICARLGLDCFGIDCAIDNRGDLLVFEVNASMLAHEDNAEFPCKDPAVRAIKRASRARPAAVSDATPLSP
jgi:glutathione synthase/RimK-type ligase-like ATP-grasp enzyme